MNDFLKNLRNPNKKDPSSPKRILDSHYHPQNERKKIPDRRSGYPESLESLLAYLTEILSKFSENTTGLTHHLNKTICSHDLLIEAKIRQYNSVSSFFDNLNKLFTNDFISAEVRRSKVSGYTSGTYYTKDDILSLIRGMRKEDATFAAIAEYLKGKGIPTFSGRGEWHAQTVHRLCK